MDPLAELEALPAVAGDIGFDVCQAVGQRQRANRLPATLDKHPAILSGGALSADWRCGQ